MRDLPRSYSERWSQHGVLGSRLQSSCSLPRGPLPPWPPTPPGLGTEAQRGQGYDHIASLGQSRDQNSLFSMAS